MSAQWSDLLSAALVGTERRPAPDLLDDAAELAVARRAAVPALEGLTLPEPAPEETAPAAPAAASVRLAGLLDAQGGGVEARLDLVVEWLTAAVDRGLRVSPAVLPELLDAARAHRSLRPLVAAAGGARAPWLAAQNPTWAYLWSPADTGNPAAWEEGTLPQRVAHLRAVRAKDPDAGRELLESGWAGEGGEDRAPLLEALRVNLSAADEALLERALDDRRREVRNRALALLAELPDSGYGRRMADRARAAVQRDGPLLRVDPPAVCDSAMQRDGIVPKPPAGVGARTWWLEEVVARTPLQAWPPDLLRLTVADGWDRVLHRALARAAAGQRAADWAAALLDLLEPQVKADPRPDDVFLLESLYEVLPAVERADRAVAKLRSPDDEAGLDRLLDLCPAPWPPELVAAFRDDLVALVRRSGTGRRVRERSRIAATRLPPDPALLDGILAGADDRDVANMAARQAVERLAETLRFRHDMIEELS